MSLRCSCCWRSILNTTDSTASDFDCLLLLLFVVIVVVGEEGSDSSARKVFPLILGVEGAPAASNLRLVSFFFLFTKLGFETTLYKERYQNRI